MKRMPVWMIATLTFVAGVVVTWSLTLVSHRESTAESTTAAAKPAALYWYDPMYPDRHFEQPGKSPFMDMQLVPKYAGSSALAEGTVQIDPRVAQNLGVRTGKAERGSLAAEVRATATVVFDEGEVSAVQARVNGIVESLRVRSPLVTVTQGQTLMVLIAPEWTAAQEEYLALRRTQSPGLADVRDAARRRLSLLGMSEAQIRAIERTNQAQSRITVVAPRDGVVTELAVREGASVMSGATLARINGVHRVWVHAAIAEAQIARVAPGSIAEVHLSAFPGETFTGTIDALLPTVDPASRTQTARIVLDNPEQRLTPGMIGEVRIAKHNIDDVVLVPSEAVIVTGSRQVVLIATGEGGFRAQEVRVGAEADGRSEILAGITDGERVVLSGQFLIDSEASLTGALSRLGVDPVDHQASSVTTDTSSADETERHQASGELLEIDGTHWNIHTGPIPSLQMGAMRMQFVGPEPDAGPAAEVGQQIEFTFFRNDQGDFEIDGRSIRIRSVAEDERP